MQLTHNQNLAKCTCLFHDHVPLFLELSLYQQLANYQLEPQGRSSAFDRIGSYPSDALSKAAKCCEYKFSNFSIILVNMFLPQQIRLLHRPRLKLDQLSPIPWKQKISKVPRKIPLVVQG